MENNFQMPGLNNQFPKNSFVRQDPISSMNNINQNNLLNKNAQFTSLDGRKWESRDQEIRANQDYYRKMLNDSMKKGDM